MKILVFDRSLDVRMMIHKNIIKLGGSHEILCVESSNSVTKVLQNTYFDLVIIDLDNIKGKLNEITGLVSKNDTFPIIIVLTFFPTIEFVKKILNSGADYCFDKIFEFEDFIHTINKIINKRTDNYIYPESVQMTG
jgi:DNA-binding response OmpR family regulator